MTAILKNTLKLITFGLPLFYIACGKPVLKTTTVIPDKTIFTQNVNYERQNFEALDFPFPIFKQKEKSLNGVTTPNIGLFENHLFLTTLNGYLSIIPVDNIGKNRKTRISKGISAASTLYGNILFVPSLAGGIGLSAYNIKSTETVWELKGNYSNSSPVVIDNLVYHTSHRGLISCLNAETGERKWQTDLRDNIYTNLLYTDDYLIAVSQNGQIRIYDPESGLVNLAKKIEDDVYSQSCVANHSLYTISYTGKLYKLDLKTGNLNPIADFKTRVYAPLSTDGQNLFIQLSNGDLICRNMDTKSTIWSIQLKGPVSCPILITNKHLVAATSQKTLYVINKKDGEIVQRIETEGRVCAPPVISGNQVIICSEYNKITLYGKTGEDNNVTVRQ